MRKGKTSVSTEDVVLQKSERQLFSQGSDLFIVDNSDDDWKVLNYLRE